MIYLSTVSSPTQAVMLEETKSKISLLLLELELELESLESPSSEIRAHVSAS